MEQEVPIDEGPCSFFWKGQRCDASATNYRHCCHAGDGEPKWVHAHKPLKFCHEYVPPIQAKEEA